jgi:exonuclease III
VKLKTRFRNFTIIQSYAPTEQADPEVKDRYYDELSNVLANVKKQDIIIPKGGMNAHVGKGNIGIEKITGRHGKGILNDNGE